MESNSKINFILPSKYVDTSYKATATITSSSLAKESKYKGLTMNDTTNSHIQIDSTLERLAPVSYTHLN